jgi:hypothetical protein
LIAVLVPATAHSQRSPTGQLERLRQELIQAQQTL